VDVIFHVVGPRSRGSVSEAVVDALGGCSATREELVFSMANDPVVRQQSVVDAAKKVADALRAGQACAFATIGDPLIYSTFGYLKRELLAMLPEAEIIVVPGITSFQAAAAVWGDPLVEDEQVLSIIPKWEHEEGRCAVIDAADTAVVLKSYRERNDAVKVLRERMSPSQLLYAARLGLEDQCLASDPDEICALPIEYLSLLISKRGGRA
jgi:precorrin-2/cobalt-factor-2 C20-methyltransferase